MNKNETEFNLSEEDKIRMKRLSQEILGRLAEMNMIVASTMKLEPKGFSKVVLQLPEKNGDSMDISFSSADELGKSGIGIMSCGVYKDPPGICQPCFPL